MSKFTKMSLIPEFHKWSQIFSLILAPDSISYFFCLFFSDFVFYLIFLILLLFYFFNFFRVSKMVVQSGIDSGPYYDSWKKHLQSFHRKERALAIMGPHLLTSSQSPYSNCFSKPSCSNGSIANMKLSHSCYQVSRRSKRPLNPC